MWFKTLFKKKETPKQQNGLVVGEKYKMYPTVFCTRTVTILDFDGDYVQYLYDDCNRTSFSTISRFKDIYEVKV